MGIADRRLLHGLDPVEVADEIDRTSAQLPSVNLPDNLDDVNPVLRHMLVREQRIIGRYGLLLDRVRGLDAATEHLLAFVLGGTVVGEDEDRVGSDIDGRPRRAG